jgi:outer membrane protein
MRDLHRTCTHGKAVSSRLIGAARAHRSAARASKLAVIACTATGKILRTLRLQIVLFSLLCYLSVNTGCAEQSAVPDQSSQANPGTPPGESAPTISPPTPTPTAAPTPVILHQQIEQLERPRQFTLKGAVEYAQRNYPNSLKSESQLRASKKNVTVQKMNEYLPESLLQWQEILASHNKLTEVFFGSPVFPAISGPATNNTNMEPIFFSQGGFSIDWSPIDFGLHKARINLAKSQSGQAAANLSVTELDVGLAAANAFLDAVIAAEQVKAAEQNVTSFEQFSQVVHAQVQTSLKPGADESLALAQFANARNDLIRAQLTRDIAYANLANSIGLGGELINIDEKGLGSYAEPANLQKGTPIFEEVPVLKASNAVLTSAYAQRKILDKEYYPVFHFLGGMNIRGGGLSKTVAGAQQSANTSGIFPEIPNYQLAMIINWNFLDIFRLRVEKKIQNERIFQQQQDMRLVLQNLRTEDIQSRARVKAALALAENMPIQVQSALTATQQAEARYRTGLGSVAQVAEANQTLAQSRVQEAIARVGVWRALLSVASAHGNIQPLLAEADRVQKGM